MFIKKFHGHDVPSDQFYFRWSENNDIQIGKAASIPSMLYHLKWNPLTVFVNFSSTKRPVCDDCNEDVIRSLKSVKGFWVGIAAGCGNDSRDNTKSDFEPKRQI